MDYVIIPKNYLNNRIKKLEDTKPYKTDDNNIWFIEGLICAFNEMLMFPTELTPEIEKAFDAGVKAREDNIGHPTSDSIDIAKQNYIANLVIK